MIAVTNHDDSRQGKPQHNRYENSSLSPMGTDQWLQYEGYFKIADLIITVNLKQRRWEANTEDSFLFKNKRKIKISDLNISVVSCTLF